MSKQKASGQGPSTSGKPTTAATPASTKPAGPNSSSQGQGPNVGTDPKKRPPKGHRQKGAGTVVVSKGDVKRDGLEIKEWQQTPKQLLFNYCRAEKRPLPRFATLGDTPSGKFLVRVILPDPKDQRDKDMQFIPKDAVFDSVVEAEHAVSLLALHKVDGARSHEMKLPEPYRSAWLKLVGRSAPASTASSEETSKDQFVCDECGKGFSKEHGLESHKRTAHPKPKKTAVGADAEGDALVSPSPSPSPSPPPRPVAASVDATSQAAPKPTLTSKIDSAAASDKKESGLLQLQAHSKFSTQHERREFLEKIRVEKERIQRQRRLEEGEDEDYVFMSEENRAEVEAIVRSAADKSIDPSVLHNVSVDEAAGPLVTTLVEKMGFLRSDARAAVHAGGGTIEEALEWLLVHLDEDRLPPGFDPRGMQLEVLKPVQVESSRASPPPEQQQLERAKMPKEGAPETIMLEWFSSVMNETLNLQGEDGTPEEWQSEWEALESILANDVRLVDEGKSAKTARFIASLKDAIPGKSLWLEAMVSKATYPASSSPLVLLRGALEEDVLVQWSKALTQKAKEFRGEPCVYALFDWAKQVLAEDQKPPSTMSKMTSKSVVSQISESNDQASRESTTDVLGSRKAKRNPKQAPVHAQISDAERKKQSHDLRGRLARRRESAKPFKVLPAHKFRKEIVSAIDSSRVVIIKGETGCGKTTQVPQFVLESLIERDRGGYASIIVTQPRRLAAVSVALRVAEEMDEEIGGVVGYRVQLESKAHPVKTRLEFVTTGLLLRRMQSDGTLMHVSHVIVDEVHERSLDSDFLLALLRQSLKANPSLKVILMSATMDAQRFSSYFSGAPVLEIPGFTYPVKDLYLEDALAMSALSSWADRAPIDRLEKDLDYRFLAACVAQCHRDMVEDGSILVFVSGVAEIANSIRACESVSSGELLLLPLHGALNGPEQRKVFARPPPGRRKVIVSTNVAETSVTIDDVVCVIDSGRMKEVRFDPATKMSSLVDTWVSAASARQRRGRAGRVREGVCLKLFSRTRQLVPDQLAEVHRVPLEQCVLQVASMDVSDNLLAFFGSLVDPPARANVEAAIASLVDIGAMEELSQKLTPLGYHLAKLPMDARFGKMLIYGSLLGVPESAATIAASLSRRSPFLNAAPEKRDEAKAAKKRLSSEGVAYGAQSDHLVLVSAFRGWRKCASEKERRRFCEDFFLSDEGMREISKLRAEFLDALENAGFHPEDDPVEFDNAGNHTLLDANLRQRRLLKACICAGLYPNVVKVRRPEKKYVETHSGAFEAEGKAKELRFELLGGEDEARGKRVFLHPSSINFDLGAFNSSWMVFSEIVNTSKPFVRDCTVVAPYGLLLFGGPLMVKHEEGLIKCGGGMRFKLSPRVAVLVKQLKKLLDEYLEERLAGGGSADARVLLACKRLIVGNGFF